MDSGPTMTSNVDFAIPGKGAEIGPRRKGLVGIIVFGIFRIPIDGLYGVTSTYKWIIQNVSSSHKYSLLSIW
jgi:hypothetical protein